MSRRPDPVVAFAGRPEPGPLRQMQDVLQGVLGRLVSFADVLLLSANAGVTVTNAAAGAGTSVAGSQVSIHLADTGADQVRLVVRGNNSAAGAVTVQLYDITNARALATLTVTGVALTTYAGAYVATQPTGAEHELEVRVIGNNADDPVLYRVSVQFRTTQARA